MRLGPREKKVVWAGAVLVVLFLGIHLLLLPFLEDKDRLERGVQARKAALGEMSVLAQEYRFYQKEVRAMQQDLQRRTRDFTLFSFLERAAGRAMVKDHIRYMRPSVMEGAGSQRESMVEMRLDNITLKQLVDYLYLIESPEHLVGIRRLSLKAGDGAEGYLSAILQVVTVEGQG